MTDRTTKAPGEASVRRSVITAVLTASLLVVGSPPLHAQDAQRGRLLYDNACHACHSRSVFSRNDRIATNRAQVQAQVVRWYRNIGLPWTAEEVDDVTAYLVRSAYKFNTPSP